MVGHGARRGGHGHRVRGVLGTLGILLLVPGAAQAGSDEPTSPTLRQGEHLRLDATPGQFVLAPGDTVQWQVGVDVVDPPTVAEVALGIDLSGRIAEAPGGMTVGIEWCRHPWTGTGCTAASTVLPVTPVDQLAATPLGLDDAAGGWLLVTATLPPDAPRSTQGQQLRVAVDARAHGEPGPPTDGEDPTPDDPSPTPPTTTQPPAESRPPGRLTETGAPLIGPALLAVASVLTGAGLAAARRLGGRRQTSTTTAGPR